MRLSRSSAWFMAVFLCPALVHPEPLPAPTEIVIFLHQSDSSLNPAGVGASAFAGLGTGLQSALAAVSAAHARPLLPTPSAPAAARALSAAASNRRAQARERLRRAVIVTLADGESPDHALAALRAHPAVEAAEPNAYMRVFATPSDTDFGSMWGLKNTGQAGSLDGWDPATGTAGRDIDAERAWDTQTGSAGTVVAVIDTGADWDHPDLAANIWANPGETVGNGVDDDGNGRIDDVRGWDFGDGDADPDDDCANGFPVWDVGGHGTHVSGTIGAVGDNGVGVAGASWDVAIMPLKVADEDCFITNADLAAALTYAADKGAHIVNMSLGGGDAAVVESAVDYADASGVLLIAAAGNDGTDATTSSYPAAYDNVLAVAATDRNDRRAGFSNYGSWVALAAPGVAIRSTIPVPDGSYDEMSGTSMASPMTAGVAALVRSQYSSLSTAEIWSRLVNGAENIDGLNGSYAGLLGAGRINAARSLMSVTSVAPTFAINNATFAVTATGVSLTADATLRLTRSGESDRVATGVSVPDPTTISGVVNLAGAAPGHWNVVVQAGSMIQTLPNGFLIESITLESVSPFKLENTAPSGVLTLSGSNFTSDVGVRLTRDGQADIAASTFTIVSATEMTAEFDVSGALGGRWNVVFTRQGNDIVFGRKVAILSETFDVVDTDPANGSAFAFPTASGSRTVSWPAGTTAGSVQLDLDAAPDLPLIDALRDPYRATGIAMEIVAESASFVFARPFELTMGYRSGDLPDSDKPTALTLAVYNPATGRWEPIPSIVDPAAQTVRAAIDHLSLFAIVQHAASASLDDAVAFPNPFRADRGHTRFVFDFLTAGARVRVYDVSGELVRDLVDADGDGQIVWNDVTTAGGSKLASGMYFYLLTDGDGNKKTGRIGVIR